MPRKNRNRQRRETRTLKRQKPPEEEVKKELPPALRRCKHDIIPAMACTWCYDKGEPRRRTQQHPKPAVLVAGRRNSSNNGGKRTNQSTQSPLFTARKDPEACRNMARELFDDVYVRSA